MSRYTIKESRRYRDITWLMPSIDLEKVLHRLGVRVVGQFGDEMYAYCPDHELFTGHESSDPNWHLSVLTGATFCWTEGRGSNLLFTASRLLGSEAKETIEFLTGMTNVSTEALALMALKNRFKAIGKIKDVEERVPTSPEFLTAIRNELESRPASDRLYEFFIHPPGKNPTGILRETVDRYRVFERTWGYYSDRAMVPFFLKGELVGFIAIDLLGEDEWARQHPVGGKYRKTLFPPGFSSGEYLFGFDDCEKGASIIITEGQREVMKLWQEGFTNAVALGGKDIRGGQIRLLAELAPSELVLMLDGDAKGWEGTDGIAEAASEVFSVRAAYLPPGKDPKNLDKNALEKLWKSAKRYGKRAR